LNPCGLVLSYGYGIEGAQSYVELLLKKLFQKGFLERGVFLTGAG